MQLGPSLPHLLGRAHGGTSNEATSPLHALLERVHGLQTGDRERRVELRDHHQGFFGALVVETRKRFGEEAGERYRILDETTSASSDLVVCGKLNLTSGHAEPTSTSKARASALRQSSWICRFSFCSKLYQRPRSDSVTPS